MTTTFDFPVLWRGRTAGGIPFRLIQRSGSSEREVSFATEEILLLATHLLAFVLESFPPPQVINGVSIRNNRPMIGTNLRTKRIRWEAHIPGLPVDPFVSDPYVNNPVIGRSDTYGEVLKVTIEYDNELKAEDPNNPKTFLKIRSAGTGEYLHVTPDSEGSFVDSSVNPYGVGSSFEGLTESNTEPIIPASVFVPQQEWNLTWQHVDREFWEETLHARFRAARGKVNDDTFSILSDAPRECLLFAGFDFEEEFKGNLVEGEATGTFGIPQGVDESTLTPRQIRDRKKLLEEAIKQPPVTVNVRLLEKTVHDYAESLPDTIVYRGWNDVWHGSKGWQRYLFDGQNPIYPDTDFDALFKAPEEA